LLELSFHEFPPGGSGRWAGTKKAKIQPYTKGEAIYKILEKKTK